MFLIEYKSGYFINAEDINWLSISKEDPKFSLKCEPDTIYDIDPNCREAFFNNLQAINSNINSIEIAWRKLSK